MEIKARQQARRAWC